LVLLQESAMKPFQSSSQAATCYCQSNHSKVEEIPLSALSRTQQANLPAWVFWLDSTRESKPGLPDDWGRPDGRTPRGSCLAISAHLSIKGTGIAPPRCGGETLAKTLLGGPNTHSMLMISPSGLPPLARWKLPTLSRRPSLDHLEEWSLKWRLPVNPAKCECCFFSTEPIKLRIKHNSFWLAPPHIQPRPQVPRRYFWRTFSFGSHVQSFRTELFFLALKHLCIVGYLQRVPLQLYKAFIRALLSYTSPGWYPLPLWYTEKTFESVSQKCLQSYLWLSRLHSYPAVASRIAHHPPTPAGNHVEPSSTHCLWTGPSPLCRHFPSTTASLSSNTTQIKEETLLAILLLITGKPSPQRKLILCPSAPP